MDFIKQAVKIFISDEKSLKSVVKKEAWFKPFLVIILTSFFVTVLDMSLFHTFFLVIATIILAFISAGSLHIMLKLFKGIGTFKQTLTVNFNIQLIPSLVFGGLAILSFLSSLYSYVLGKIITSISIFLILIYIPWFIILMTQGLSKIHTISLSKSYIAQIVSLLVTTGIGLIIIVVFISIFLLPDPMFQQFLIQNQLLIQ